MPVIETKLNPRDANVLASTQAMQALVDDLRAKHSVAALGGGDAPRA